MQPSQAPDLPSMRPSLIQALTIGLAAGACCYQFAFLVPMSVRVTMSLPAPDELRLFWDEGDGFSERESVSALTRAGQAEYTMHFNPRRLHTIRLDPCGCRGEIRIDAIRLDWLWNLATWDAFIGFEAWEATNNIASRSVRSDSLVLVSDGFDPYLTYQQAVASEAQLAVQRSVLSSLGGLLLFFIAFPVLTLWRRSQAGDGGGRVLRHAGRLARSSVTVISVTLVSAVLGEASLRIYDHFFPTFVFYDASYNRFRGQPLGDDSDFRLNSMGFKDVEFGEKKEYRILGIGDSFAFGVVPYRNNYLTLLEEELTASHAGAEVLNMGIPNLGPVDYLSLFVNEGLQLQPDMVLLSFYIGNDFAPERTRTIDSYSYLLSLLDFLVSVRPRLEGGISYGSAQYCDECPSLDADAFTNLKRAGSALYRKNNRDFQGLVDNAASVLTRIGDICRQRDIDLVVVLIPDEIQVSPEVLEEVAASFSPPLETSELDLTRPNLALVEKLKGAGIDTLDLYPAFLSDARNRRLYKPRDTHWNIAGNQLAARLIAEYIGRYLRVPVTSAA